MEKPNDASSVRVIVVVNILFSDSLKQIPLEATFLQSNSTLLLDGLRTTNGLTVTVWKNPPKTPNTRLKNILQKVDIMLEHDTLDKQAVH
jgi:hypothetical protein